MCLTFSSKEQDIVWPLFQYSDLYLVVLVTGLPVVIINENQCGICMGDCTVEVVLAAMMTVCRSYTEVFDILTKWTFFTRKQINVSEICQSYGIITHTDNIECMRYGFGG